MEQANLHICRIESRAGVIWISGNRDLIAAVSWNPLSDGIEERYQELGWFSDEMNDYLSGSLKRFSGGLSYLNHTPVWMRNPGQGKIPGHLSASVMKIMSEIPYGTVRTYGSIAGEASGRQYARAVGRICGSNPLAIVIPCHRVVAASSIGGYSAGLDRKRFLLGIEGLIS